MKNETKICSNCKKEITITKQQKFGIKNKNFRKFFCNQICRENYFDSLKITLKCDYCNKEFSRLPGAIKQLHRRSKTNRNFCSKICAGKFNVKIRKKSRRSKCEIMLFDLLSNEFKNLQFVPNDRSMLDGYEIDIAIPSLNLGIEWNGAVHFKPMYGEEKLKNIMKNDYEKQQTAQKKGIHLIIVSDLVSDRKKVQNAFVEISNFIKQLIT